MQMGIQCGFGACQNPISTPTDQARGRGMVMDVVMLKSVVCIKSEVERGILMVVMIDPFSMCPYMRQRHLRLCH
jgi:hypothetical protein